MESIIFTSNRAEVTNEFNEALMKLSFLENINFHDFTSKLIFEFWMTSFDNFAPRLIIQFVMSSFNNFASRLIIELLTSSDDVRIKIDLPFWDD